MSTNEPQSKPRFTNGQILIGLILFLALACAVINAISNALARPSRQSDYTPPRTVRYFVQADDVDEVEITFINGSGEMETIKQPIASSWSRQYNMSPGDSVSLMVRHRQSSGRVVCKIIINNGTVSESEREGDNVAALCTGTVE